MPFRIATINKQRKNKIPGNQFSQGKKKKDLYNENSKILRKETEEDTGRWQDFLMLMDQKK